MTDSDDRQLQRLPSLDGLRALAVVLTSLVHIVPELVPGGFLGVAEVVKLDEASGSDFRPRVPDLWVG